MKKTKKVLAVILLFLMFITQINPVVQGASGSGQWVGAQYASGFRTTSSTSSYGILIRRLQERYTGVQHTVFCMQHGVEFDTGVWYSGDYYTPTTAELKLASKIAYFGWYSQYGWYVVDRWNFR